LLWYKTKAGRAFTDGNWGKIGVEFVSNMSVESSVNLQLKFQENFREIWGLMAAFCYIELERHSGRGENTA
jgi:hypothetical protein